MILLQTKKSVIKMILTTIKMILTTIKMILTTHQYYPSKSKLMDLHDYKKKLSSKQIH